MDATRRDFVRTAAAAVAGAWVFGRGDGEGTAPNRAPQDSRAKKPLKILVLGGTNFLGPKVVDVALARGHAVTVFSRGRRKAEFAGEVERLEGDRDPKKGEGLKALEGRSFDVVLDHSGYYPRLVKASAELLAPRCGRYLFVSSISAYAETVAENADESAPLAKLADPTVETMGENYAFYGGLKALCEAAAEAAFPGRATIVRPTYICGPGDPTDRFTYWPARFARGGEIVVPGTPEDPIQIVDVRDLAEWIVLLSEQGTSGAFHAVGPTPPHRWGKVVEECERASAATKRTATWIPADFMETFVKADDDVTLPIWIAPKGLFKGMHRWNNARAVKAGLKFRPLADTVRDTLAWWAALPEARRAKLGAGLSAEKEAEILAAWRKK
jgi:2'-hydroxyisoflavone reductase